MLSPSTPIKCAQEEQDNGEPVIPSSDFSKLGIKLSYLLNDFVEKDCGGKSNLIGLTTTDVATIFVKPLTSIGKKSFCDQCIERQKKERVKSNIDVTSVSLAEVFISHSWSCEFLSVLGALEDHFESNPDIFIWFDLFSNNQHEASTHPHDWWQTVFKSAIKEIGFTVMVLSPWDNPIPYTRAWCIYEAYCTIVTGSHFEIAMSADDRDQFIIDVENDPCDAIDNMLGTINAEKSTAFFPFDRDQIFQVIRKEVGFPKINKLVFEQYREWVVNIGKRELQNNRDKDRRPKLYNMLGMLYMGQGKYRAASTHLEKSLSLANARFGPNDAMTLKAMANLAASYKALGNIEDAEILYKQSLERTEIAYGPDHISTLERLRSVVGFYFDKGKSQQIRFRLGSIKNSQLVPGSLPPLQDKAEGDLDPAAPTPNLLGSIYGIIFNKDEKKLEPIEELYVECLKMSRKQFGPDSPKSLDSLRDLASLYRKEGKTELSTELHSKCHDKRRNALGIDHPDTLQSANSLATLYARQEHHYGTAENLYASCLEKRKIVLGTNHPATISTMSSLAVLLFTLGKYEKAENLFRECMKNQRAVWGYDHPDYLDSLFSLGSACEAQGKYQAAEAIHSECLKKRVATLGPLHADTTTSASTLIQMYSKHGKYLSAFQLEIMYVWNCKEWRSSLFLLFLVCTIFITLNKSSTYM